MPDSPGESVWVQPHNGKAPLHVEQERAPYGAWVVKDSDGYTIMPKFDATDEGKAKAEMARDAYSRYEAKKGGVMGKLKFGKRMADGGISGNDLLPIPEQFSHYWVHGEAHGSNFDEKFATSQEATEYASSIIDGDVDSTVTIERLQGLAEGGVTSWPQRDTQLYDHLEHEHNLNRDDLRDEGFGTEEKAAAAHRMVHRGPFANADHKHTDMDVHAEGVAVAENVGDGVPAIIGEEGPEAVIPLDSPAAVEVMAQAIAQGQDVDDAPPTEEEAEIEIVEAETEAAVEIVEAETDAAVAIVEAETEAAVEIARIESRQEEEIQEAAVDAAVDIVEEKPTEDVAVAAEEALPEIVVPEQTHWWYRKIGANR